MNEVKENNQIQVLVRIKPLAQPDEGNSEFKIVNSSCLKVKNLKFEADHVFNEEATSLQIFEQFVEKPINDFLEGFNATIFTYGQTGCGKSYTIYGSQANESEKGLIYHSIKSMFNKVAEHEEKFSYKIYLNYYEIYNEEFRDLLKDQEPSRSFSPGYRPTDKFSIFEDPLKGTQVSDLNTVEIDSLEKCMKYLSRGNKKRSTGSTSLNNNSSRSHALAVFQMERQDLLDSKNTEDQSKVFSRLNFVDLAGSERQKKTETTGLRFIEATKINLSLSSLGNVINALSSRNRQHIPYRSSKLTRVLRDSLGGNSNTIMVACVSRNSVNLDETISTLRYASRAGTIENSIHLNMADSRDILLAQYKAEIDRLKSILDKKEILNGSDAEMPEVCEVKDEMGADWWKEKYLTEKNTRESLNEEILSLKEIMNEPKDFDNFNGLQNDEIMGVEENFYYAGDSILDLEKFALNKRNEVFQPSVYKDLLSITKREVACLKKQITGYQERLQNAEILNKLLGQLLKVASTNLPRESNYHNTYEVAMNSIYSPNNESWQVPEYKIEKQTLPSINQDDVEFREMLEQSQMNRKNRMSLANEECEALPNICLHFFD